MRKESILSFLQQQQTRLLAAPEMFARTWDGADVYLYALLQTEFLLRAYPEEAPDFSPVWRQAASASGYRTNMGELQTGTETDFRPESDIHDKFRATYAKFRDLEKTLWSSV